MSDQQERPLEVLQLTADIVASHVSNNSVTVGEMPQLIKQVYDSLSGLGGEPQTAQSERPQPGSRFASRSRRNTSSVSRMARN